MTGASDTIALSCSFERPGKSFLSTFFAAFTSSTPSPPLSARSNAREISTPVSSSDWARSISAVDSSIIS